MKSVSKYIFYLLVTSLLFLSCQKKSAISTTFNCETAPLSNLETVEDIKDLFSAEIPKNWKTNLYQDEIQSSIYTADTTKQLTKTMLLDLTFIQKKISFDDAFILKQEQEYLAKGLITLKSKKLKVLEKPSYIMVFRGKKGKFDYQICNTFIKVNDSNFILAKTEVYGGSLVNQRLCEAFSLIENIKINN